MRGAAEKAGTDATGNAEKADLIAAYRATTYWVIDGNREVGLRIDTPATELTALYDRCSVGTAAFITAYNPFSRATSLEANEYAQAKLKADLLSVSEAILDGRGEGDDGKWPPEPSFLALGITREDAEALGRTYGQNAIVWIGGDQVPRLVILKDLSPRS